MIRIAASLLISCAALVANSQQTRFLNDPQFIFHQAKEYFQKEQYSLAYPLLKDLELQQRSPDRSNESINFQEIAYYTIVCGLKQNEKGAAEKAQQFIDLEDNVARVQQMSFHLAEYYFRQQDYARCIGLYESANIENLSNREIADMKFHQGYSYFTAQRYAEAKPHFDDIRRIKDDPNYPDANYYFGFISFYEGKFNDALEAFTVVEDHEEYGKAVPYYIAVIYYMRGEHQKAFEYAERKLKRGNLVYDKEMRKLVGHGYFLQQQYDKALPFLEEYNKKTEKLTRADIYELSYSYYKTGNWNKSIEGFKQLGGKEDSLAQNAMYLLGDAYLKTGQKANARNAFLFCSSNSSNAQQKEISQFNYAKLSYELGYQDVAIEEFKVFLQTYPNSTYNTEARELMVSLLTSTNNYKDALELLDGLKTPTANSRKLYPRILYGRAAELINDGMLVTADEYLAKAEKDKENNTQVLPFIHFWRGEIAYRLNKLDDAIRHYFDYLKSAEVSGEANPTNARYNLGYCYLRKENYKQALGFFEQIVKTPRINSPALEQDAYIRTADCHYMERDYKTSMAMYNKVLEFSWPSSDYATFQKGMVAGINNSKEKINLLTSISRRYPSSNLIADANMEIAVSYLANEQYREAIPYLKNVVSDPNASLKPKAHLRLGIAYYNLNNNTEALKQYAALLQQYPNSADAEEALDNAKVIYVEEGRSAEYVNFARGMGKEISTTQEEQLAYQEAEVQFNNGNFPAAAAKFESYLGRFPQGKHSLEALYYKSEIYLNQKDFTKAVDGYEILAGRVPHRFGEKSLLNAARINFFDLKKYDRAEGYYAKLKSFASTQESKLEAMRGLLRCQFQLAKWSEAVDNARELLNEKGVGTDDRILANMAIARAHQSEGRFAEAITAYRSVSSLSKSEYGAEARYGIAYCFFEQNKMSDAEKAAFEVINKSGSYEQWVTRAYILLGDVYYKQKDYFNAKATYQSVIDNAKIESLRTEAEAKLNKVKEEEKKASNVDGNK